MKAAIRGVSEPHGMFLTGHPQQMIVFADGIVFARDEALNLYLRTHGGIVGGIAGELTHQSGTNKLVEAAMATESGQQFSNENPKLIFVARAAANQVRLYKKILWHLEIQTIDHTYKHKFAIIPNRDDAHLTSIRELFGSSLIE